MPRSEWHAMPSPVDLDSGPHPRRSTVRVPLVRSTSGGGSSATRETPSTTEAAAP